MLFNSFDFLVFFPITVLIYYICPLRLRYLWLLGASYYFYMQWNPLYIVLLFFCTTITYAAGLLLEKWKRAEGENRTRAQKLLLAGTLAVLLGILGFYKYFDFALQCISRALSLLHLPPVTWQISVLLPVGISFYTLQAMGYLIDVYRDDIYAERNFFRYALFLSFFPQLVAGPIERSRNLLKQLYQPKSFSYDNLRKGMVLVFWGLFCKLVIADRAAIIVDTVYGNAQAYGGLIVIFATLLFAIQIYCDFYGYSTIARGVALTMGIRLMENFNAPYFSKSVKEFWSRWHLSLSGWFRDYLYIPLGGNRKGELRKQENRLVVFTLSGLWHGASISFVVWGLLNGIYQIGEDVCLQGKERYIQLRERFYEWLGIEPAAETESERCFSNELWHGLLTFALVTLAWLFFRAGSTKGALRMIKSAMVIDWKVLFDGSLYELGVAKEYVHVLFAAIGVLFYVDYKKYRGKDVAELLLSQGWWFRSLLLSGLIFAVLLLGCYGVEYDIQEFIYFQF